MNESHSILQRMRELAVQSANDTNEDKDRAELQKEVDQLAEALTDISENTQFNEKDLLKGDFSEDSNALTFHVGANEGQQLTVTIDNMSAEELEVTGESGGIDISSQESADEAISTIQEAIDTVSSTRSELGAVQNRLEHTINNLGASSENLTAAESRIRDTDHTETA